MYIVRRTLVPSNYCSQSRNSYMCLNSLGNSTPPSQLFGRWAVKQCSSFHVPFILVRGWPLLADGRGPLPERLSPHVFSASHHTCQGARSPLVIFLCVKYSYFVAFHKKSFVARSLVLSSVPFTLLYDEIQRTKKFNNSPSKNKEPQVVSPKPRNKGSQHQRSKGSKEQRNKASQHKT